MIVGYARAPAKIIGGHRALPGEFKHQVLIRVWGWPNCGGSIISTTHILTAAHCVDHIDVGLIAANYVRVVTGTIDSSDRRDDIVFRVDEVIAHNQYTPHQPFFNDIAILKVNPSSEV